MADPVGITGTAVGLVSMGLQLYGEISKYIDAVNGRERDLELAKRQAETLKKCLLAIRETTSSIPNIQTASNHAVDACVMACEDDLNGLKDCLGCLRGSTTPAGTLSARAKEKARQLSYPFHKSSISALENRLVSTNTVLQTALHSMELQLSTQTNRIVSESQLNVAAMKLSTENTSMILSDVSNTVKSLQTNVAKAGNLIPEIHSYASKAAVNIAQQTQTLSMATQVSIRTEENTRMIQNQVESRMERFEELLTQLISSSAERQSTQRRFEQLIARPSDLRILCDELLREGPNSSQTTGSRFICPCKEWRYTQRNTRTYGPFFFESQLSRIERHALECPLSRLTPFTEQTKRGLGVNIIGAQGFLQKAIRFSFSFTTGSGGSTISQSLTSVATVNSKVSPVFRLGSVAVQVLDASLDTGERYRELLESCWRRIFWCYAQKIASPTDIDQNGSTLLASILPQYEFLDNEGFEIAPFVKALLQLGIPVNTARGGTSPELTFTVMIRSRWLRQRDTAHALLKALEPSFTAYDDSGRAHRNGLSRVMRVFELVQDFPEFTEVLQFGPLMTSILHQDLKAVSNLLLNYPSSLYETNSSGQTPIHVAVLMGSLPILDLVISLSNLALINTADADHYYPVEYATMGKLHACHADRRAKCRGCGILDALLTAGARLFPDFMELGLGNGLSPRFFNDQARSSAVQEILLRHLKERRLKLLNMATKNITWSQIQDLSPLEGNVLDRNAARVQMLLEALGLHVPSHLSADQRNEGSESFVSQRTIYSHICDRTTAKYAWKLGFRDLGHHSTDGLYLLVNHIATGYVYCDVLVAQNIIAYVSWLADRGLDLKTSVPSELMTQVRCSQAALRLTPAHYLMRFLGGSASFNDKTVSGVSKNIANVAFSQTLVDGCSCRCSLRGCTPLTKFFDPPRGKSAKKKLSHLLFMCRSVMHLIPRRDRESTHYSWVYRAILRYITFVTLQLRHTCCDFLPWVKDLNDDEIEEIRSEERDRLLLLEELCIEFEVKCRSNARLIQFVRNTWMPRMLLVLEDWKKRKLTAHERLEAESIGIIWDSDLDSDCEEEAKTRDELLSMLEDIVPEKSMDLPQSMSMS